MNRNVSLQSYFMEHAPKSGQSDEACNRAVDVLQKNDVYSMWGLAEKNAAWVFNLFLNEKEELDGECHDLVREMQGKYLADAQKTELLAAGMHGIEPYFKKYAPAEDKLTTRAINALRRTGIETMIELCAATVDELEGVRNLGSKSLEVALLMREKYMAEICMPVTHSTSGSYE